MPHKKQSSWISHVKKTYHAKKKSNPNYKYSHAMKDAKKTYKKH
eukprot:COSAG01_NODE_4462_length_5001_cov_1.631654_6_plen_44_part_00